jgi:hypothetical protein
MWFALAGARAMSEIDYRRAAREMMKKHGDNAGYQAALRGDELRDQGDLAGFHTWWKTLGTINWLEARTRRHAHWTSRRRLLRA